MSLYSKFLKTSMFFNLKEKEKYAYLPIFLIVERKDGNKISIHVFSLCKYLSSALEYFQCEQARCFF